MPLTSNCEKQFILAALSQNKRVDGRKPEERREFQVQLGGEWGTAISTLGETRVLAVTSAFVSEPRSMRPNEGVLLVNVDSISGSKSRGGQDVELVRLLERVLRESNFLDMESLCICSEERVWTIKLDLTILNDSGNVADCASVAGLTALCHFRRPDVTLRGNKIKIHPFHERDPVSLSVHHHPILSTFALYGSSVLADPTKEEEAVMDGKVVFGMNPYKEICALHLSGQKIVDKSLVLKLASQAAEHAKIIVHSVKEALKADRECRKSNQKPSLSKALRDESVLMNFLKENREVIQVQKITAKEISPESMSEELPAIISEPSEGVVELMPTKESENSKHLIDDEEEEEVVTIKGTEITSGNGTINAPA